MANDAQQPLYVQYCASEFLVIECGQPTGLLINAEPGKKTFAWPKTPGRNDLTPNENGQCAFTRWGAPEVAQEITFRGVKPIDYDRWLKHGATPQCSDWIDAEGITQALLAWAGNSLVAKPIHLRELGVPERVVDTLGLLYTDPEEYACMVKALTRAALASDLPRTIRVFTKMELGKGAQEAADARTLWQKLFGAACPNGDAPEYDVAKWVLSVLGHRPKAWHPKRTQLFQRSV